MKKKLKTILMGIGLACTVSIIFPLSSNAEELSNSLLKDVNGKTVKTGQEYYLSPSDNVKRGLSYKKSTFWDYLYLSKDKGKPIKIYKQNDSNKSGLSIVGQEPIFLKMDNRYVDFGKAFSWVWLDEDSDDRGILKTIQPENKNEFVLYAGEGVKYMDAFGRPTDQSWFGDNSVVGKTYFETSFYDARAIKKYDDKWADVAQMDPTRAPKYVLVPVK